MMAMDEVDAGKKMGYPKAVFFIILNEFCERFSYYGMRTGLSLYFVDILLYSKNTATVMYHTFTMFAYFFPLIGAMIADSWLGKFRTILYLSIVYAAGQLLLSVSSVPSLHLPVRVASIIGLLMIALGTGGIKPCVSAFGGDQFKLPEQEIYLTTFFSLFYVAINSGSLISTFLTPILRKDVTCFDLNTCYPLAFLVPAILMIVSIVIFFAGKRLYKMKKPEGNVVLKVTKCISHAIGRKMSSKTGTREHWLDHADDEYDRRFIEDIKSVLKVLKLFIPLPIFWALFDQQGSRWTFQATRMDGEVFGYLIKPDQFQVINPLLIIIFIPIFQFAIYPIIEKFLFINTPLRKLTVGGFLASLSFVISGLLEFQLEPTYAAQPYSGVAHVRIYNAINCKASLEFADHQFALDALATYQNLSIPVVDKAEFKFHAKFENCQDLDKPNLNMSETLTLKSATSMSWGISRKGLTPLSSEDVVDKSESGDPRVRTLIYQDPIPAGNTTLKFVSKTETYKLNVTRNFQLTEFVTVNHKSYDVYFGDKLISKDVFTRYGGVYTVVGTITKDYQSIKLVTDAEPNSVHMFWLLPQYIVITMGEIMFSVTGLEFAFTQAPTTMKSLLQAAWLLTVAFGNLIVVIIAEAHFFDRQVFEFFLFAVLMFIDMLIFAVMARLYKYIEVSSSNDDSFNDDVDAEIELKKGIRNDNYSADL